MSLDTAIWDMKPCRNDYVRSTTELARRLGVSRRTMNRWRHNPDAPQREGRWWHVPSWLNYLSSHRLGRFTVVERSEAAAEVAALLRTQLPLRVPRTVLKQFMEFLEALLPGMFGIEMKRYSDQPSQIEGTDTAERGENPQEV